MIGEQAINVLDSLFSEGKAAAVISGPWNLEPFSSAGIDYGILPLPELPNGNPMSAFVGVKSYNVSSYSKNSELAELFIEFITNEENSLRRYQTTKEVPAVKSLAEGDALADDPAAQAVAQQSLHSELTPNVPEMNEVWSPAGCGTTNHRNRKSNTEGSFGSGRRNYRKSDFGESWRSISNATKKENGVRKIET